MIKSQIKEILIAYSNGEMHLNNAVVLLGGGLITERIIRQWMDGKMSFAEAVEQINELLTK